MGTIAGKGQAQKQQQAGALHGLQVREEVAGEVEVEKMDEREGESRILSLNLGHDFLCAGAAGFG